MTEIKSILIKESITIKRREGNTSTIRIIVPEVISVEGRHIHFGIFKGKTEIISKVNDGDREDWTVDGQEITAILSEADTMGRAGHWQWELELWDETVVYTIAAGSFIVTPRKIGEQRHGD